MTMVDFSTAAAEIRRLSRENAARRDAILASKFYLVNIGSGAGSIGERLRCRNCRGVHRFLTLRCVERPFDGLEGGLYGAWAALKDMGVVETFDLEKMAKYQELTRAVQQVPNLGASHPDTVRLLNIGDRDVDLGAVAVGFLEPITAKQALERVRRINARGVKFSLPGLERSL